MNMLERLKALVNIAAIQSRIKGDTWEAHGGRGYIRSKALCPLEYISGEASWEKSRDEYGLEKSDESTMGRLGTAVFLRAADGDPVSDEIDSPEYKLRQHMITTLQIGLMLLLVLVVPNVVHAQDSLYGPICSPYENWCTPSSIPFANVPINVEGLPYTNLALVNLGELPANTRITVSFMATPTATEPTVVVRHILLKPFERRDVFLTNGAQWPELTTYSGGVSVMVKASQPMDASVWLHPPVGPTFYTGAKILEGK